MFQEHVVLQEPLEILRSDNRHGVVNDAFSTFFSETSPANHVPRTICVDLEPTVNDEVKTWIIHRLSPFIQLLSGKKDAGNGFENGYYTVGMVIVDPCCNRARGEELRIVAFNDVDHERDAANMTYNIKFSQELCAMDKLLLKKKEMVHMWHKWKSKRLFYIIVKEGCCPKKKAKWYTWHKWKAKLMFLMVIMKGCYHTCGILEFSWLDCKKKDIGFK